MISKTRVNSFFENIMKLRNKNQTNARGRKKDILSTSINQHRIANSLELHRSQLLHQLLQLLDPTRTCILNSFVSVHLFLGAKLFKKEYNSNFTKEALSRIKESNLFKPIVCKMIVAIEWFSSVVTIQAAIEQQISKVNFKKYI